ncbi:N-acetyltransferase [Actinobacteria bacterium YIM 96077]|uniref:GNAT family N-acetyltransferase n=1 Tax=Phytoactinopolyspora halophila TaxID=1981511 RepID=A0A329QXR5_9ACTN|nr:GNAT family N-acetyltransferase [Phytoactinopolyspora halophila]AYY15366.1 N-acetyltransferase [Actinobacteria bacterium YIM 96077]RAW16519.1 GNAT family N-acetyltransferase [Phytoactinopolyspora halophila]
MAEQPVADKSVRIAWAADAEAIGQVQARAWLRFYGTLLPQQLLNEIDGSAFAQVWRQSVTRPPTAKHRVLVALDHGQVCAFAATQPCDDPDASATDGEISAFHVDPDALGQGHGSRLLTAAVDTLRADAFQHARMWIVAGDDPLRHFVESAGWAADTAHRTLDLTGDETATLKQIRVHTDLGS